MDALKIWLLVALCTLVQNNGIDAKKSCGEPDVLQCFVCNEKTQQFCDDHGVWVECRGPNAACLKTVLKKRAKNDKVSRIIQECVPDYTAVCSAQNSDESCDEVSDPIFNICTSCIYTDTPVVVGGVCKCYPPLCPNNDFALLNYLTYSIHGITNVLKSGGAITQVDNTLNGTSKAFELSGIKIQIDRTDEFRVIFDTPVKVMSIVFSLRRTDTFTFFCLDPNGKVMLQLKDIPHFSFNHFSKYNVGSQGNEDNVKMLVWRFKSTTDVSVEFGGVLVTICDPGNPHTTPALPPVTAPPPGPPGGGPPGNPPPGGNPPTDGNPPTTTAPAADQALCLPEDQVILDFNNKGGVIATIEGNPQSKNNEENMWKGATGDSPILRESDGMKAFVEINFPSPTDVVSVSFRNTIFGFTTYTIKAFGPNDQNVPVYSEQKFSLGINVPDNRESHTFEINSQDIVQITITIEEDSGEVIFKNLEIAICPKDPWLLTLIEAEAVERQLHHKHDKGHGTKVT